MEKDFTLNLNHKQLVRLIKIVLITLLLVIEALICAQYVSSLDLKNSNVDILKLLAILGCCLLLSVLFPIDCFLIKYVRAKMVFFVFDIILLLLLCLLTGNTYLSVLYCIVLTQFYISLDDIKSNLILFAISCALFVFSFVGGWVSVNKGASFFKSFIDILTACIFGVAILGIHFLVTNFILRFYSNNAKLRHALKEAEEHKTQLKEVYEELSRTAVFEERNRIAKDIHDNAGHSITTVIMQTEAAKLLIDSNPEEAKNRLISANIQAKNALEQMRESVHLLAGRAQARSLREEIEEIIAQTIDGTELKIRCDLEDVSVGGECYRFICNSVKESLANGIRHGGATAFYIELKKSLSGLILLISDNGKGVEGEILEGFGLKGLREKAEKLGGRCDFTTEAGDGFEVEISLPLNSD